MSRKPNTKSPKQPQVSVRQETHAKLRAYCRKHGVQMRSVLDDIINAGLDKQGTN